MIRWKTIIELFISVQHNNCVALKRIILLLSFHYITQRDFYKKLVT